VIGHVRVQALGLDGYSCTATVVSSWEEDGAEGQRRADIVAEALEAALDENAPGVRIGVGAIFARSGNNIVDVLVAARLLDACGVRP
jgi:hypothetical protein